MVHEASAISFMRIPRLVFFSNLNKPSFWLQKSWSVQIEAPSAGGPAGAGRWHFSSISSKANMLLCWTWVDIGPTDKLIRHWTTITDTDKWYCRSFRWCSLVLRALTCSEQIFQTLAGTCLDSLHQQGLALIPTALCPFKMLISWFSCNSMLLQAISFEFWVNTHLKPDSPSPLASLKLCAQWRWLLRLWLGPSSFFLKDSFSQTTLATVRVIFHVGRAACRCTLACHPVALPGGSLKQTLYINGLVNGFCAS